jgi:hypothetical protein
MDATKNIAELQERMEEARQLVKTVRSIRPSRWTVAHFEHQYQLAVEAYRLRVADYQRTGR